MQRQYSPQDRHEVVKRSCHCEFHSVMWRRSRWGALLRSIQTGRVINTMWAEEKTVLCKACCAFMGNAITCFYTISATKKRIVTFTMYLCQFVPGQAGGGSFHSLYCRTTPPEELRTPFSLSFPLLSHCPSFPFPFPLLAAEFAHRVTESRAATSKIRTAPHREHTPPPDLRAGPRNGDRANVLKPPPQPGTALVCNGPQLRHKHALLHRPQASANAAPASKNRHD